MKIRKLIVGKYKNLKGINLDFEYSTSLMIGQNGLGKSNLIEILSIIFSELYLAKTEQDIIDTLSKENYFGYDVTYQIGENEIRVYLNENPGSLDIWVNGNKINFPVFNKNNNLYLPTRIVGYYSGENKRVLSLLEPHIEQVKAIQRKRKNTDTSLLRQIFFVENYHSQLILLTLSVYKDYFIDNTTIINQLLREYLEINKVESFDIKFNNPDNTVYSKYGIDRLGEGFSVAEEDSFWRLQGSPQKLISLLFDFHMDKFIAYHNEDDLPRKYIKEILEFPSTELEDIQSKIIEEFPNPLDFFDALDSANILGVLGDISITVDKVGVDELIKYEQLSEGEQQLVSTIGILILAGKEDSLFLIDEPDTHINPSWQRNLLQLIKSASPDNNNLFITTHSPFLVQENIDGNLLLFRKDDSREIIIDTKDYKIDNWKIDHVLTSPYFSLPSARPSKFDEFMRLRSDLINRGTLSKEEDAVLKKYENESGHFPTGETFTEIETQVILKEIADKEQ